MITETSPVVAKILSSNRIDDETKFLAITEILNLEERNKEQPFEPFSEYHAHGFNPNASDIDEMFEWSKSELPMLFWVDLQDEVFTPAKRTC
jgi:hypothetical protein